MELYQAYTDYHGMMDLTENLFRHVATEVLGTTQISYNGIAIDLGKPFARLTMLEAVKQYSGVDFNEVPDTAAAKGAGEGTWDWSFEVHHEKGRYFELVL